MFNRKSIIHIIKKNTLLLVAIASILAISNSHAADLYSSGSGEGHGSGSTKARNKLPAALFKHILRFINKPDRSIQLVCKNMRLAYCSDATTIKPCRTRIIYKKGKYQGSETIAREDLTNVIIQALNNRPYVNTLSLQSAYIEKGHLEVILEGCPRVSNLDLDYCPDYVQSLTGFESLPHIESISLTFSWASPDEVCKILKVCNNLHTLNLAFCMGSAEAFSTLQSQGIVLEHLKKLNLSSSGATQDNVLALLKVFINLQELNLEKCAESTRGFSQLAEGSLLHLKVINLTEARPSADSVSSLLKASPNLQRITLNLNKGINSSSGFGNACRPIGSKKRSFPHLKEINLEASLHYRSSDILRTPRNLVLTICEACPNLQTLNLSNNDPHVVEALADVTDNLQHMKTISLKKSDANNEHVKKILLLSPNLQELDLSHCNDVAEAFINLQLAGIILPNLKRLNLQCTNANEEQIKALAAICPNLQTLNLSNNKRATVACINAALEPNIFAHLRVLKLFDTGETKEQLAALCDLLPKCKVYHL